MDLINVASLPLQNAVTIATATANLFTIVIATPNKVYSLIVSGQVDQVPAAIQAGIASQGAAIQTFVQLPATIIATDAAAIVQLLGNFGSGASTASTFATTNAPALTAAASPAAAPSGVLGIINVVTLPLQNAITIATATADLFGIVIATPNKVYSLIASGQVDQVPAAIQTGIANEAAAIQKFVQLPATIIATDVAAIAGLFGGIGAPAPSTFATTDPPALMAAARTVDTPALTSFAEEFSQPEASTAFTADLPKDPSAEEDSATSTALTATNDAELPDATLPDATLSDATLPDPTLPDATLPDATLPDATLPDATLSDATLPDPDGTTTTASPQSGDKPADPADDTPKPGASSVSTNGTGHQATSKPNTEGGQDVSNTTNTNTFGGRHRADGTATNTTNTNTFGGRHRVRGTAPGSNAGTSSASSPESDSNEK